MKYIKKFENFTLPSHFSDKTPYSSIFKTKRGEHEIIAQNIMVILDRTGNKFRYLSWEEYKKERLKDGDFSDAEKKYFDEVIKYCTSPENARSISKNWDYEYHAKKDAEKYNL
jgi:hypothetical protein